MDTIPNFFCDKSILLTGASGFVGSVLLETLLRCCPGINSIYIVLREKKGLSPQTRKEELLKKEIFNKIREGSPESLQKVHCLAGDVSQRQLGMKEEDLEKVIRNVSIVFHCAACVSFFKTLKFTLAQNCGSTQHVIELCRKLRKLDVLVYTSTAYGNVNRGPQLKEEIYPLPFPLAKVLDPSIDEAELERYVLSFTPRWANWYTVSKCITERLIQETASDLPVAIVRPSLVMHTWRGASPGFLANESAGIIILLSGIASGFLKVSHGHPKKNAFNFIPADIVANTEVIAAWSVATGRSSSPLVVHCDANKPVNYQDITNLLVTKSRQDPYPGSLEMPSSVRIQPNAILYWIYAMYYHFLPAVLMHFLFKWKGKESRIFSSYQILTKTIETSVYFTKRDFYFHNKNMIRLSEQLNDADKEIFDIDVSQLPPAQPAILPRLSVYLTTNWNKEGNFPTKHELKRILKIVKIVQQALLVSLTYIAYRVLWNIVAPHLF